MDKKRLEPPPMTLLDRYRGHDFASIYKTRVTVSGGVAGHGRASGIARSDDGNLMLDLRLPEAMGGPGNGTNPEQLFAAGFAACFHGALSLVAKRANVACDDMTVSADVAFGRDPADGAYALVAEIRIRMPGIHRPQAEILIRDAERLCPYAKMARAGITCVITLTD